jgi:hypothetical protein
MSFPGLRGFSVKQTRSGKADGPLVGSGSPAGSRKAPDPEAVMEETAAAGPTEAGWTEEVVARPSWSLGTSGPVVGVGWSIQSEARPGETTMVVINIIPRPIMQTREEKSTGAHVATDEGLHHFKFFFLSLLAVVMLMDN